MTEAQEVQAQYPIQRFEAGGPDSEPANVDQYMTLPADASANNFAVYSPEQTELNSGLDPSLFSLPPNALFGHTEEIFNSSEFVLPMSSTPIFFPL